MIDYFSGDGNGKKTQTAGTRINVAIGGLNTGFTNVINMNYSDTGTAHTLTLMRGASRSTVVGAVAAAGTSVVVAAALLDGDGNALAANDYVCIKMDNGLWHISTVATWTVGTLTLTLNAAVPTGRSLPDGTRITVYGVAGDTFHAANQRTAGAGTSAVNFPSASAGMAVTLCRGSAIGEPILFDSNNATNAGTLNEIDCGYTFL